MSMIFARKSARVIRRTLRCLLALFLILPQGAGQNPPVRLVYVVTPHEGTEISKKSEACYLASRFADELRKRLGNPDRVAEDLSVESYYKVKTCGRHRACEVLMVHEEKQGNTMRYLLLSKRPNDPGSRPPPRDDYPCSLNGKIVELHHCRQAAEEELANKVRSLDLNYSGKSR